MGSLPSHSQVAARHAVCVRARASVGVQGANADAFMKEGRGAACWRVPRGRAEATHHGGLGGEIKHASDVCCASGERKAIPAVVSEEALHRARCGSWPCCVTAAALLQGDATACVRAMFESYTPCCSRHGAKRGTRTTDDARAANVELSCRHCQGQRVSGREWQQPTEMQRAGVRVAATCRRQASWCLVMGAIGRAHGG